MEPGNPWLLVAIGVLSFALAFVGASVGLILGHLRLPMLVAYFGVPGTGTMTNLIISGVGAMAGAASHVNGGRVAWKGVALIGIPSCVGAIVGVLLFVRLNPVWSYLAIGVMLVISGVSLIRKKTEDQPTADIDAFRRFATEVVIGLVLGALAAVTGLMLGSLRLPMMIRYLRMDPKEAIGTNMVVGCLTAFVGSTTAFLAGDGQIPWLVMAAVVPPTILGGWMGGLLTGRISKESVQRFAGIIVTITGVLLIGQGVAGTIRRPQQASEPLVEEWEHDEWLDFGDVLPNPEPDVPMEPGPDLSPQESYHLQAHGAEFSEEAPLR